MSIVDWWYGIIDSWFGATITIGIVAMVIGALVSIVKSFGQKGTNND